jgi:hypothetical protein
MLLLSKIDQHNINVPVHHAIIMVRIEFQFKSHSEKSKSYPKSLLFHPHENMLEYFETNILPE